MSVVVASYLSVGTITVLMFGAETSVDLLDNVSRAPGKVSKLIRIAYIFLLICHLPYYFFSVKEYILVIIDEIVNRSLSTRIEQKLSDYYAKR